MDKITKEMREALRCPLPQEAITQHPTKKFLSSIKAIYVEERLNEVFGVGSWTSKVEFIEKEMSQKKNKNGIFPIMVVVKLTLEVPKYGIYHESYGGNDNEDLGDAYKGATTDALTKICSYLEIGIDVFKGKSNHPNQRYNQPIQSTEKIGVCSVCGQQGIKAKRANGTLFTTCPDWKSHRDKKEKFEIVMPDERTKEQIEFQKELDNL